MKEPIIQELGDGVYIIVKDPSPKKKIKELIRSSEEFRRRYDLSTKIAGDDFGWKWNDRFLLALRLHGLMIERVDNITSVDRAYAQIAPPPYKNPENPQCMTPWTFEDLIIWTPINPKRHLIVCSAVRGKDGWVVSSLRHYDALMHEQIRRMTVGWKYLNRPDEEQGFLDNYGIFLTREQAFPVALASGQLNNVSDNCSHLLDGIRLYSEMLY